MNKNETLVLKVRSISITKHFKTGWTPSGLGGRKLKHIYNSLAYEAYTNQICRGDPQQFALATYLEYHGQ